MASSFKNIHAINGILSLTTLDKERKRGRTLYLADSTELRMNFKKEAKILIVIIIIPIIFLLIGLLPELIRALRTGTPIKWLH